MYLQKAWTDSINNPSESDITIAIKEIQQFTDEHGAFWVGTDNEEFVLEIHNDLSFLFFKNGETSNEGIIASWKEAQDLFLLLLNGKHIDLPQRIKNYKNE